LAEHPNIVGVKLTCANLGKLQRITSTLPKEKFAVFPGKSDILLQGLLSGGAGVIGGLVNIAPKTHVRLYGLWERNEIQQAMQLQSIIGHADWTMQKLGGISGVKGVVWRNFGYGQGFVRGPLAPVSDEKVNLTDTSRVSELIRLETTSN
jgi:4-hydroxy-2-oxoglutarate aldolase